MLTEYNTPAESNRKQSFTLELTTTALCDLGCTYCFEGEKTDTARLDKDIGLVITRIDSILADTQWFQKHYEHLNLSFWGGEPTLNPQFIINIMNVYKHNPKVDFHIYTNAFNIKNMNKVVDNVDTSTLQVQVSYDGKLVNDKYRLTKNKKATSNQVLKNLYILADKGVNVSLKSTLPIDHMETLLSSWIEFEEIQNTLWSINKQIDVTYSPTIDYVTQFTDQQKEEALVVFRDQFLGIAKRELAFFKKHGRHLCTWFGGEDNRKHCSAGLNMAAISQKGDLFACHGALYADKKEEMKSTTIYDKDFLEKLQKFSLSFVDGSKKIAKECQDCQATTCMICPVMSNDKSEKENFEDRWLDNFSNKLCAFFKTFGEIDRSVQQFLFQDRMNSLTTSQNIKADCGM